MLEIIHDKKNFTLFDYVLLKKIVYQVILIYTKEYTRYIVLYISLKSFKKDLVTVFDNKTRENSFSCRTVENCVK